MPWTSRNAEVLQDVGDFVVDGVDQVGPAGEGLQPLPGQGQRFLVAVDADQVQVREALEHGFGVSAHAQRGIDGHRGFAALAGCFESGRQQIDAPVLEDRHMAFGRGFGLVGFVHAFVLSCWCRRWSLAGAFLSQIPIRAYPAVRLAPGK